MKRRSPDRLAAGLTFILEIFYMQFEAGVFNLDARFFNFSVFWRFFSLILQIFIEEVKELEVNILYKVCSDLLTCS